MFTNEYNNHRDERGESWSDSHFHNRGRKEYYGTRWEKDLIKADIRHLRDMDSFEMNRE